MHGSATVKYGGPNPSHIEGVKEASKMELIYVVSKISCHQSAVIDPFTLSLSQSTTKSDNSRRSSANGGWGMGNDGTVGQGGQGKHFQRCGRVGFNKSSILTQENRSKSSTTHMILLCFQDTGYIQTLYMQYTNQKHHTHVANQKYVGCDQSYMHQQTSDLLQHGSEFPEWALVLKH
jgi:hypothetical protein